MARSVGAQYVFEAAMLLFRRSNLARFSAFVSGVCVGGMGLALLVYNYMSSLKLVVCTINRNEKHTTVGTSILLFDVTIA